MARPQTPALTVDVVIPSQIQSEIQSEEDHGKVVLIRRANEPCEGHWALPGGFVDVGESVEDAARREVHEETGLEVKMLRLVGVYSKPERPQRSQRKHSLPRQNGLRFSKSRL